MGNEKDGKEESVHGKPSPQTSSAQVPTHVKGRGLLIEKIIGGHGWFVLLQCEETEGVSLGDLFMCFSLPTEIANYDLIDIVGTRQASGDENPTYQFDFERLISKSVLDSEGAWESDVPIAVVHQWVAAMKIGKWDPFEGSGTATLTSDAGSQNATIGEFSASATTGVGSSIIIDGTGQFTGDLISQTVNYAYETITFVSGNNSLTVTGNIFISNASVEPFMSMYALDNGHILPAVLPSDSNSRAIKVWRATKVDPRIVQTKASSPSYVRMTLAPVGKYACRHLHSTEDGIAELVTDVMLIDHVPIGFPFLSTIVPQIGNLETMLFDSTFRYCGTSFYFQELQPNHDPLVSEAIPIYFTLTHNRLESAAYSVAYPISIGKEILIYSGFMTAVRSLFLKLVNIRIVLLDGEKPQVVGMQRIAVDYVGNATYAGHQGRVPVLINADAILGVQRTIGNVAIDWLWQWSVGDPYDENTEWKNIRRERIKIHCCLDLPSSPWSNYQQNFLSDSLEARTIADFQAYFSGRTGSYLEEIPSPSPSSTPAHPLIEAACTWAKGTRNEHDALSAIAWNLIESDIFIYIVVAEYSFCKIQNASNGTDGDPVAFNLGAILDTLDFLNGKGCHVDCFDLSHLLMFLANSIGCNAKIARIVDREKECLVLQPVIPLGSIQTNGLEVEFHDVVYLGETLDDDTPIFDLCFSFFRGIGQRAGYVSGMPFGEYRQRVFQKSENCAISNYSSTERILFV